MNEGLIPRRYAKALYKVALERGCDSRVYQLMKTLDASFATAPALQPTVANPFVSDADKAALIRTAAGADSSDALLDDFIKLLLRNRRIEFVHQVALAYIAIYREANSIYRVHVDSAAPLLPDEEARLRALIERHLGQGAQMEYSSAVVPDLIGGFRISVGNERLDASIANELEMLRQKMIN